MMTATAITIVLAVFGCALALAIRQKAKAFKRRYREEAALNELALKKAPRLKRASQLAATRIRARRKPRPAAQLPAGMPWHV